MTPLLLALVLPAQAIDREATLDNAAIFATHEWTMGSANQYASCSSDYVSDYTPGHTYRGIPYDWGGWVTADEYDDYIAAGYGAGSHSWHGVLSCTVGVDCSGFVSQAWETSTKYGTSTFYQVTSEISASSLKRGDALNNAGSHIVLFAYETAAGIPVHYEANGDLVFVDSDQGWSAFSSYEPIRYDAITDGGSSGTSSNPHEITAFPFEDLRWTAGAASDSIDSYSCASSTNESGPEQLYRFSVAEAGTLTLRVSDDSGVDIDIHVLTAPTGSACLARDDTDLSIDLSPGEYWIAADTWVGSYEYAGPYILTATFSGTLGEAGSSDEPDDGGGEEDLPETGDDDPQTGDDDPDGAVDTGSDDQPQDGDGGGSWGGQGDNDDPAPGQAPGQAVPLNGVAGGGCQAAPAGGGLVLILLGLWRRRRGRG